MVLKREWYFSLPLVIITVLMIIGRSPGYSAFWATLSCIAVSWVRKETRMGPKEIWEAIQTGRQQHPDHRRHAGRDRHHRRHASR